MPTFKITGPDGKSYRVSGENAEGAFQALQQHMGTGQAEKPEGPALPYGQPPEGMSLNPSTGQMEDLRSEANPNIPSGGLNAAALGIGQGIGFNLLDEAAAGASALTGGDYDYDLARMREAERRAAEEHPGAYYGGQVGGAIGGAAALGTGGLSFGTNTARAGNGLGRVAMGSAADGAIFGAAQGFGAGEGVGGRAQGAAIGGAAGGALGGAAPYAIAGAQAVISPFLRPFMSRMNPDRYASKALNDGVRRSGMTIDDIANSLTRSQADDQGMFNVADAMGHSGRRMLSTVARTPNDMRQTVVDTLTGRQMDQGRRIASNLQEASGSQLTASQHRTLAEQARSAQADINYRPVRTDTTPIDVTDPVRLANRSISPMADNIAAARNTPTDIAARKSVEAGEASIRDPIRQAMKEARSYLASDNLTVTNVEKAFRAKTNIDQMIATATERGQGGLVSELIPMQNALDEALARTSTKYSAARDAYRLASENIDAIDTGRQMAMPRSRLEDNLNTFGALSDDAQKSARVGYFDPLITQAENRAGQMSNSARSLLSPRMQEELPTIAAPGRGDQLMRRVGREQTMFETANTALGGSKTADNLADAAELSKFDPTIMSKLFSGRPIAAAMDAAGRLVNEASGMPPSVTARIATALLETNPAAARQLLDTGARNAAQNELRRAIASQITGGIGGSTTGRHGAGRQPLEITVTPRR